MCNFLSAIVLKSGDVLCDPTVTDSHEDLVDVNNLRDNGNGNFVRVEFTPHEDHEKIGDLDSWIFKVDQEDVPEWFEEKRESVILNLRDRVRRMFVDSEKKILGGGGGCWILLTGANIGRVLNARIYFMTGDAQVHRMHDTSQVHKMFGTSQVHEMCEASQVHRMHDTSQVHVMRGTSQVHRMHDTSQVHVMRGTSQVHVMYDTSMAPRSPEQDYR